MEKQHKLERSLSLFAITMYGIGSILGAGIYVLVGKVAGFAGMLAPISFVVATIIAAFSGISYAKLSSMIPKAGGEFAYIIRAFKSPRFAQFVAFAVMLTGIVSAATMANGFVGYLQIFLNIDSSYIIIGFIIILSLVSLWGIQESAFLVTSFALIEFAGLIFVLFCLRDNLGTLPDRSADLIPASNTLNYSAIFSGAFLAFFAFIGFEDMVNVAEEVKNPRRNMPLSIIIALIVTSIIYILISLAAVLSLSAEALQNSTAPMADLIASKGFSPKVISVVSLFSISNGAVVQIVMAARVLFSMARKNMLPGIFKHVNPRTKTPVYSTVSVMIIVLTLALFFNLETLAETTSFIVLCVFALVNLSLLAIQINDGEPYYKRIVPVIGFLTATGMVAFKVCSLI